MNIIDHGDLSSLINTRDSFYHWEVVKALLLRLFTRPHAGVGNMVEVSTYSEGDVTYNESEDERGHSWLAEEPYVDRPASVLQHQKTGIKSVVNRNRY